MKAHRLSLLPALLSVLLLGAAISAPAHASTATLPQTVAKGNIQNIDYLHHAITVNGQTYAVAGNAKFSGIGGFSVLHIGMPIAYTLGPASTDAAANGSTTDPASNTPPVITHITWLPGGT